MNVTSHLGSVATLKAVMEESAANAGREVSGRQLEQLVDELILLADIVVADPRACALRNMFIASYPAIVSPRAINARKPCLAFTDVLQLWRVALVGLRRP